MIIDQYLHLLLHRRSRLYKSVDLLNLDIVPGSNSCSKLLECKRPSLRSLSVITSIGEVIKTVSIYCSFQIQVVSASS